jgi:hypothetical protein
MLLLKYGRWITTVNSPLNGLVCREKDPKRSQHPVVDREESTWLLDDDSPGGGTDIKTLMITLAKPPLTQDEITWKRGRATPFVHVAWSFAAIPSPRICYHFHH